MLSTQQLQHAVRERGGDAAGDERVKRAQELHLGQQDTHNRSHVRGFRHLAPSMLPAAATAAAAPRSTAAAAARSPECGHIK